MKPSTGMPFMVLLSHRAVEAVVKSLGLCREVWFQHLHAVGLNKFVYRIVGILEVDELAGASRASLATGRGESLGDAVVAECVLRGGIGFRIQEAAAIRA